MYSVEEAKNVLLNNIEITMPAFAPIENAGGLILAEDIFSPVDLPPFNQSAMDGYAVNFSEIKKEMCFKIICEIKAGDVPNKKLKNGEAARIFTGAVVPDTADCVVMQEKVFVQNGNMYLEKSQLKKSSNIRQKSSQIRKGELALAKDNYLNTASIGFLASMGIKKVKVYPKPKIAIVVTGNELQTDGKKLKEGKIFESNSVTLYSALREIHLDTVKISFVIDEKMLLKRKINDALKNSDVLLISGGVSVGKYDLVSQCLKELNVKELFYKVAQKPGKPLFVGKKKEKMIFALPGNPAAALVCFYEYVFPALRKFMGYSMQESGMRKIFIPCSDAYSKNSERAHFLKCKIIDGKVKILEGQESFILKSFVHADGLIYLPEKINYIVKGENVEVHLLPNSRQR